MILIKELHKLFQAKKPKKRREAEIRKYAKDAIKTYEKTLRKLAYE